MYVRSNSFADNSPADGGQVRSELDNIQRVVNRTAAVYVQSITTNTLTDNQIIYRGWGHTGNLAAASGQVTITLPNGGFDDTTYEVFVTYLGEKTTGAPTSRIDINQYTGGVFAQEDPTLPRSATQFRVNLQRLAGNFPWVLFSWMAVGTKT